jgi:hypothetical protein
MAFSYTFKKKTGHIRIAEGSTEIPDMEFAYRGDIRKVTIPQSVTLIGDAAFYQCNLSNINIPDSVTQIGYYALARNQLKGIDIPDSVTSIGKNAFWDNDITEAKISNSLTSIEKFIFADNEIKNITLPNSVTEIGEGSFSNNDLEGFNFPESLTTIGIRAFAGNFISDFAVPDSVESILSGAFENNAISKVILPDSFKSKELPVSAFDSNVTLGFDCEVALSIRPNKRSLDEGQGMNFKMFACAFPIGTTLYWKISGINIDQNDFNTRPIEGYAIIDATQKFQLNFETLKDTTTEGTESFRLSIYSDLEKTTLISQSNDVKIIDAVEEKPEPPQESSTGSDSDSNPASDSGSDSDSNPASDSGSDSDSNPASDSGSDSDSNPASDSGSDSDSNPASNSSSDSDSNPASDSGSDSDSNPDSQSASDANSDSKPDSESGSDSELNDSSPGDSSDSLEADNIIFSVQGKGKLKGSTGIDEFRFDIFDEFKKKKADKIKGFEPDYDFLTFTNRSIPQLTGDAPISFAKAKNRKRLIRLSKKNYDFIYYEKKGRLYWDSNGTDKKWGDPNEGGLIAILKGKPELNMNDILIS